MDNLELEIADIFTTEDALEAIANAKNQKPIGMTAYEISEIIGCSVSKVRKELRKYAKQGRLVVRKYPVRSPLDGKTYPVPHYFVKAE